MAEEKISRMKIEHNAEENAYSNEIRDINSGIVHLMELKAICRRKILYNTEKTIDENLDMFWDMHKEATQKLFWEAT